jgi:predicted nicotinamide N-methyase
MRLPLLLVVLSLCGCDRYRQDLDYNHPVEYSWSEPDLVGEFSLFEGVHWNSGFSQSLRPVIIDQSLVSNRSVLDLFSGPGVIAATCGHQNAKQVLSLAENKISLACTRYNVAAHEQDTIVTVRPCDLAASPLLPASEKFDVILATLANDASDGLDRRIEMTLECVQKNLELSGRAFVVCENEQIAATLKSACKESNLTIDATGFDKSLLPIFELKRPTP